MTRRSPRWSILIICAAVSAASAQYAAACSVFCADGGGQLFVGRGYDWRFDEGMIVVNKRGQAKTAFVYAGEGRDGLASWTSRYGSVSFVQYGRENAFAGMNEAGLTAHEQWLDGSKYPAAPGKPSVSIDQFIQYALDTCRNVAEVERAAAGIRLRPTMDDFTKIHFFFTDAAGDCLVIDCLDGKLVRHSKRAVPIKALTNDDYDLSLRYYEDHGAPDPSAKTSPARFSRLAAFLSGRPAFPKGEAGAIEAFEVLDSVRLPTTVFQMVFDLRARVVYFKSSGNPALRRFAFDGLDYSPLTPSMVLDLNAPGSGDVLSRFVPYTAERNEALVRRAWADLGYTKIDDAALRLITRYPDTFGKAAGAVNKP
jgi:penicillin V acylase-like amidase (Ntn superfamily)